MRKRVLMMIFIYLALSPPVPVPDHVGVEVDTGSAMISVHIDREFQ
ncbi:hypothetical protein AB0L13_11320 [Saccharopolyspora shandongensis]